jgi:hypothetical protein
LGGRGGNRLGFTGHQPPDAIHLILGQAGKNAGLDVKPPSLNSIEQL